MRGRWGRQGRRGVAGCARLAAGDEGGEVDQQQFLVHLRGQAGSVRFGGGPDGAQSFVAINRKKDEHQFAK